MNEPTRTVLFVERRRTAPVDPEAWKKLIGAKPVDARLETLPETKMRRGVFAVSTTVQIALAVALAALPLLYPESLSMRMIYQVTPIAAPVTEVPVPAEPPAEQPKAPKAIPEPDRAAAGAEGHRASRLDCAQAKNSESAGAGSGCAEGRARVDVR